MCLCWRPTYSEARAVKLRSNVFIVFVSKYALYSLLMSLQIKSWSGPSATKSENLFSESKNSRPRHGRHLFVDGPSTL